MDKLIRFHKPGEGVGYKPPMDPAIFAWLVTHSVAIVILGAIIGAVMLRVG